ncbi:MAG: branched-chain amino acid transport system permease protein, partial [Actinomycetota bacterium]|nr:branched-chain amino acid transport system permease protein [Actinomycetota bacterium]
MTTDTVLEPTATAPVEEATAETKAARPRWRLTRGRLIAALALMGLAALPIPFGDFGFFVGQYALIYAIIGLSVVVVTGYAGLISLMPYSFAGIGAIVVGVAMASWGWPFWLALPLGAVATAPVSIFVGITSVRL